MPNFLLVSFPWVLLFLVWPLTEKRSLFEEDRLDEQKSNKELAPAGQVRESSGQWTERKEQTCTSRLSLSPVGVGLGRAGDDFSFSWIKRVNFCRSLFVCLVVLVLLVCCWLSAPCSQLVLCSLPSGVHCPFCEAAFSALLNSKTSLYFTLSSLGNLTIVYRACFAVLKPAVDTVAMVCAQTVQSSYRAT